MASKQNPWKQLSSKVAHKNPYYYVRQDQVIKPDGSEGTYDVVVVPPSVFIVPLDEAQNVYLVGQFRYPSGEYSYEIPSGGSEGQERLMAAKRELEEEAGLIAENWKELGKTYAANGYTNEVCYSYLATGLTGTKATGQIEDGILEVIKVSLQEAFAMVKRGEISDNQTITALMLAALELGLL